jgi:glycosyltransferase involved in cell wall biosynthesis
MNVELHSARLVPDFETSNLDCRCYFTDDNLLEILAKDKPNVIVSFGSLDDFPKLMVAAYDIRKKWLHFENADDLDAIGRSVYYCFMDSTLNDSKDNQPLVSVLTPAYNTGELLLRPYKSLVAQDYPDWEWVVIDDSDDDHDETFKLLKELAEKDPRVRPYRAHEHSGLIGKVKHDAASLSRGRYLAELDHDDELTFDALTHVVAGFKEFPEAGFLYSDCAEINEARESFKYPEGWGFGYGSYYDVEHQGVAYKTINAANINPKTIRHIVAAPNHIRVWERDLYFSIGGHNRHLHVADDYELMVRTFLNTRMVHVPRLCYFQFCHGGTTNRVRNKDIQRLVRYCREWYDKAIHERFVELGVEDFVWDEKAGKSDMNRPNPEVESHCTLTAFQEKN